MKNLIIFGTGEMSYIATKYFSKQREIKYYCVDDEFFMDTEFLSKKVIKFSDLKKIDNQKYDIYIALAYSNLNKTRQNAYIKIKQLGFNFASYIDSRSFIDDSVKIGDNCFIFENQTIQLDVKIGNNNIIWSSNHIGHGSKIADNCFISSHVVIGGNCNINDNCFMGVNSSLANNCNIGKECFIGMGSQINKNMADGQTSTTNNTIIHDKDSKISRIIKKKFK